MNKKLPPSSGKNASTIGRWVVTQQQSYTDTDTNHILRDTKIRAAYEALRLKYPLLFISNEDQWYLNLKSVETYFEANKKMPSKRDTNVDIKYLGEWLSTQRSNYKNLNNIMKDSNILSAYKTFRAKYLHDSI